MNKTSMTLLVCILCVVSFFIGHKVGDSRGYADGYNEGYRYDCKEEIAAIYKQVKAQSKVLDYTDSSVRQVMHENDSLRRKEYYQKRHQDSISMSVQYSVDSAKYHVLAREYGDSVAKSIGSNPSNFIMSNGKVNTVMCFFAPGYKDLRECQKGFDVRKVLDSKLKNQQKKRSK